MPCSLRTGPRSIRGYCCPGSSVPWCPSAFIRSVSLDKVWSENMFSGEINGTPPLQPRKVGQRQHTKGERERENVQWVGRWGWVDGMEPCYSNRVDIWGWRVMLNWWIPGGRAVQMIHIPQLSEDGRRKDIKAQRCSWGGFKMDGHSVRSWYLCGIYTDRVVSSWKKTQINRGVVCLRWKVNTGRSCKRRLSAIHYTYDDSLLLHEGNRGIY